MKQGLVAIKKSPNKAKLLQTNCRPNRGCATLTGEVPQKSFQSFQNKTKVIPQEEEKKKRKEEELQRSFANCLRRSAVKIPAKKYIRDK